MCSDLIFSLLWTTLRRCRKLYAFCFLSFLKITCDILQNKCMLLYLWKLRKILQVKTFLKEHRMYIYDKYLADTHNHDDRALLYKWQPTKRECTFCIHCRERSAESWACCDGVNSLVAKAAAAAAMQVWQYGIAKWKNDRDTYVQTYIRIYNYLVECAILVSLENFIGSL